MAQAGGEELDPDLVRLRLVQLELGDLPWLAGHPADRGTGPSNIGNYLAGLGIPATAGFGVDYTGLHGTDERIRLDSIPAVHAAYHQALLILLHGT